MSKTYDVRLTGVMLDGVMKDPETKLLTTHISNNDIHVNASEKAAISVISDLSTLVNSANSTIEQVNGAVAEEATARQSADAEITAIVDTKVSSETFTTTVSNLENADAVLQAAIDGKVSVNGTDRLMTVLEGNKLAAYPDYSSLDATISAKASSEEVTAAIATASTAAEAVMDEKIAAAIASVHSFKGQVANMTELEAIENKVAGDIYNVISATNGSSAEYFWTGSAWEEFGTTIDMSGYATKDYADGKVATETERAQAAEEQNANAIGSESTVREEADTALNNKIDTAITSSQEADSALSDRIDAVEGDISIINSGDDVNGSIANAVKAETIRATTRESEISTALANEVATARSAEQTNAAGIASEITRAQNAESSINENISVNSALISSVSVRVDDLELAIANKTSSSDFETAIATVTAAISAEEQTRKKELLNYTKDYTAVEVYPTSEEIPAGTVDPITGLTYTNAVAASMTAVFKIRTICPTIESDVVIDWGDGDHTYVKDAEQSDVAQDGNEYDVVVRHTYMVTGRYIVKFFGTKYFGFKIITGTKSIVSRVFDSDLPVAKHLNAIGNIARNSDRLLNIDIPTYMLSEGLWNLACLFANNSNLINVTGAKYLQGDIRNCTTLFSSDKSLITTDFVFPAYIRDGILDQAFQECSSLSMDISKLFPTQGFIGNGTYSVNKLFYKCSSLSGTVPADKLWENSNITWINTSNAFTGCSDAIRAQVPVSWGGTNTEIQAKIDSGYFKKVIKNDITTAIDNVTEIIETLNSDVSATANGNYEILMGYINSLQAQIIGLKQTNIEQYTSIDAINDSTKDAIISVDEAVVSTEYNAIVGNDKKTYEKNITYYTYDSDTDKYTIAEVEPGSKIVGTVYVRANTFNMSSKSTQIKQLSVDSVRLNVVTTGDVNISGFSSEGSLAQAISNASTSINTSGYITIKDSEIGQSGYNAIEMGWTTASKNIAINNIDFTGIFNNNVISIFRTESDSVITISNCRFEKCSNPLRISNADGGKVTINLINCEFEEWEGDTGGSHQYSGMIIFQDYTSASADATAENNLFGPDKISVNIINCTHAGQKITWENIANVCATNNDKQLFYVYGDKVGIIAYDVNRYPKFTVQ